MAVPQEASLATDLLLYALAWVDWEEIRETLLED